jgi:hypothetical protein
LTFAAAQDVLTQHENSYRIAGSHADWEWSMRRVAAGFVGALMIFPFVSAPVFAESIVLVCNATVGFPALGFGAAVEKYQQSVVIKLEPQSGIALVDTIFLFDRREESMLFTKDEHYIIQTNGNKLLSGSNMIHEQLTINRYTGELSQLLTLADDRVFSMMDGTCQRSTTTLF